MDWSVDNHPNHTPELAYYTRQGWRPIRSEEVYIEKDLTISIVVVGGKLWITLTYLPKRLIGSGLARRDPYLTKGDPPDAVLGF